VTSLCDRTGAPHAKVRSLFAQEYSRLGLGAKVRSYLAVLTASNVRAMLRRERRNAQADSRARPGGANWLRWTCLASLDCSPWPSWWWSRQR